MEDRGKYLPVLYTIPRWNLVRGSGRSTEYYVPYIDKWVNCYGLKSKLSKFSLFPQDYYDRWFLNITVKSDRPKCTVCNRECKFINVFNGYYQTCCNKECLNKINSISVSKAYENPELREAMSITITKVMDRPGMKEKLSEGHKRSYIENPKLKEINSQRQIERFSVEGSREEHSKIMKDYYSNHPESKIKLSESHKELWEDESYRNKQSESHREYYECHPEKKEEISNQFKELCKDPSYIEKLSNSQKKRFEDPKEREKISKGVKLKWKDEDWKNKVISDRIENYKNHPEISEKKSKSMKITTNTPEYKKMCSDRMKERWKDENYRKERHEILNNIWENPTDTVLNFPRSKPNTSKLYSEYEDKEIYLDSSWEVAFYIYNSLLNKDVKIIYREPIGITYINPFDNLTHKYFPDFYIIYEDGSQELIEIKPEYNLEDEVVKSKLNAAKDICYLTGISFRIVTDDEIKKYEKRIIYK